MLRRQPGYLIPNKSWFLFEPKQMLVGSPPILVLKSYRYTPKAPFDFGRSHLETDVPPPASEVRHVRGDGQREHPLFLASRRPGYS